MKFGKSKLSQRIMAGFLSAAMLIPLAATTARADENLILTPTELPDAVKGTAYAVQMESERTQKDWYANALPEGLEINRETGVISGTPTTAGKNTVYITDYNSSNPTMKQFTLEVLEQASLPVIQSPESGSFELPEGHLNKSYRYQFKAEGGDIHWSATGLPRGMNMDLTTGFITGVPEESGRFTITVDAENTAGKAGSVQYTLQITSIPEIITTGLPSGMKGKEYNATVQAKGDGQIKWSMTDLPKGLTFDEDTGVISGNPTEYGTFDVSITAKTSAGTHNVHLELIIANDNTPIAPKINDIELARGIVGHEYTAEFTATGTAPMTWSANGLPSGLAINKDTGVVSGKPTAAGTFAVTVTVDNEAGSDELTVSMIVDASANEYTIVGRIDNQGRIEGENPQYVSGGNDSKAIKFIPAEDYRIAKVFVNGEEVVSARGKASYTFEAVANVLRDYEIIVKTEEIPSRESGLGIDNITENKDEDTSATNAGGRVEVGKDKDYDKVNFRADEHTVSFVPENGWEHRDTFDVVVTKSDMSVIRFTLKTPTSTGSLKIANSSEESQNTWDKIFPEAKATVRGKTITIRLEDDAADMPFQVLVKVGFEPTLTARASSNGGEVSCSNFNVYAEAAERYKVGNVVFVDPVTGKSINITDLPRRENARGEFYDRETGDFAGELKTKIAGEIAKVWISGNIEEIKSGNYVTDMDIYLDDLPIALKAEVSFISRNADDTENDDYDEDDFDDNTGNLTIKNVVKNGSKNKAFVFSLYFPSNARNTSYRIDGDVRGEVEHGDSIVLYGGEQATIYGLPEGVKYSIEMEDPGNRYKTNIEISNGDEYEDALDTGNFSIRDGRRTTVVFENIGGQTSTDIPAVQGGTTTPQKDEGNKNLHTGR